MRALLVERDPLQARILASFLEDGGFSVQVDTDCPMTVEGFDIVVMEQDLANKFIECNAKRAPKDRLPVILLVDDALQDDLIQGLQSGHYTTSKPVSRALLLALVDRAIRSRSRIRDVAEELARTRDGLGQLSEARFEFRTREEASAIMSTLSHAFPCPNRAAPGILELLVNAVEHGNLEIGGARKQSLIEAGELDREIACRLANPEFGARKAQVILRRHLDRLELVIQDEGPGFDWTNLEEDVEAYHGRGIEMARALSFTHLRYEPPGNRVVATVLLEPRDQPVRRRREAPDAA